MWPVFDSSHKAIFLEIEFQSDRAAGILACAYLEDQLADAIKADLADESQVIRRVFTGYGPLATFSSKIDMALLLNIIDRKGHKELTTLRKIRNYFAHGTTMVTFKEQRIKDLCDHLPKPHTSRIRRRTVAKDEHLKEKDFKQWTNELFLRWTRGKDTPRNRFMRAVKLYAVAFALHVETKRREGIHRRASPDKPAQPHPRRAPVPSEPIRKPPGTGRKRRRRSSQA